jgi:hypothetical protein
MRRIAAIAVLALVLAGCTPRWYHWKPPDDICYLIDGHKVCRGEVVHPVILFDE